MGAVATVAAMLEVEVEVAVVVPVLGLATRSASVFSCHNSSEYLRVREPDGIKVLEVSRGRGEGSMSEIGKQR